MQIQAIAAAEALSNNGASAISWPEAIYKIVEAIFRSLQMTIFYVFGWSSIFCRHLRWFPTQIPSECLKVSCRNIASLQGFHQCLKSAFYPIDKHKYCRIGEEVGLRIPGQLFYQPASGLCLGTALVYVSKVLSAEEIDEALFIETATSLKSTSDETILKIQALYDGLIGVNGQVSQEVLTSFCQMLSSGNPPNPCDIHYEPVKESLTDYLQLQDPSLLLRQYVLDDLESKKVEITPDLYALTLELDAYWQKQNHPDEQRYLSVLSAIIQTVAHLVDLEVGKALFYEGNVSAAIDKVMSLPEGSYLVQFRNHTTAFVKTEKNVALLDPSEGLGLSIIGEETDLTTTFIHYYSSDDLASMKIISLHVLEKENDDE